MDIRIKQAFKNTDKDMLRKSIEQRNPGPNSAGSYFLKPQTLKTILNANWKPLTTEHGAANIKTPAIAFEAPISGILGADSVDNYDPNLPCVLQPAHAGKGIDRATGKLMAELVAVLPKKPTTNFTTLIIGPGNSGKMILYTFHPGGPTKSGAPIFMEDVKKKFNSQSDIIHTTIGQAKQLGYSNVKHVNSLPEEQQKINETLNRWRQLAGIIKG